MENKKVPNGPYKVGLVVLGAICIIFLIVGFFADPIRGLIGGGLAIAAWSLSIPITSFILSLQGKKEHEVAFPTTEARGAFYRDETPMWPIRAILVGFALGIGFNWVAWISGTVALLLLACTPLFKEYISKEEKPAV